MGKLPLKSDTALLDAKNKRIPLGPDSAGKAHVPYVNNDAQATPVGSFHYYPSGRLALFENRMHGGKYYWLYGDNARSTVLCQFDPYGQGTACYPNGKLRLTSTKAGGTLVDEHGSVLKSWTEERPLKGDGVSFALNESASFAYASRYDITLLVTLGGQEHRYELGEQLVHANANYQSKKLGTHALGPERGKAIVDVGGLAHKSDKAPAVALSKKTRITEADLTIAALHPIVRDADEMRVRVQGMLTNPWIEAALMPSRSFGSTGDPRTFATSMDDARWSAFLGQTPPSDYAPLALSAVLKNASGRYRLGAGAKTARVRLAVLEARGFDDFIASTPPAQLSVVCCLASWLPQSTRAESWLEVLNGELRAERDAQPFKLYKYDMSASRALRERYNINTLPMYLFYYQGKLAHASNVLNGFGSGKEDMRAQAADTLVRAQAGQFLPADFKFGKTDNALMSDMSATLGGLRAASTHALSQTQ
jgi:hypothetical protein